jgi:hypothetical protein
MSQPVPDGHGGLFAALLLGAQTHSHKLNRACRVHWDMSGQAFHALKQIVHLGALALAGFAISNGGDPFIALVFALIIISGPELLEWWLVSKDYPEFDTQDNAGDK